MSGDQNFVAKIIRLGRITIPHHVRELLNLNLGDFVEVTVKKIENIPNAEVPEVELEVPA